ncbi:MAG: hypothetical protein GKR93_04665 [Gammaproteobacteria bacterium]|nr:hypothetical protein [Gammaproteobacteria bacterium]
MSVRLDVLLRPKSIAIVGASQRAHGVGNIIVRNLLSGEYSGKLYAVNPGYKEVEGVDCYASLAELPAQVEHVIFAVSDKRIEAAFDEAIEHGISAATIYSSLILEDDSEPCLRDRIHKKAVDAGILLCGANGMGFYNFSEGIWACGFDTRMHRKQGNVAYISQSGSGMAAILDVDERIDFNFAVSTGQELIVSAEDYLDFALDQKETRVIGFFMETSRYPEKLFAAFQKARQKRIPIVVVKVGRTELSSKLAESHSGAMAGSDAVYDAVFDYYGIQRVDDLEEMATTLIMFAQPHEIADGALVSIHDSGGERQLMIDMADKLGVAMTELSEQSTEQLQEILDPGLPAVNPLDAWSVGGPDSHQQMADCFATLLSDENAAFGAVVHARAPGGTIYAEYLDYLRAGHEASGKAVFLVAARQGTGEDNKVLEFGRQGFPVLDGVSTFLKGARCMMNYRDYLKREVMLPPGLDIEKILYWRNTLVSDSEFTEHNAANLLRDFGIPMLDSRLISNKEELLAASRQLDYPLVLKTAGQGIQHKSDVDGVRLNIETENDLLEAYDDFSARLGKRVLLAPMVNAYGVEMLLGLSTDEQFGPVVIVGTGGLYAEALSDNLVLYPPFDADYVRGSLSRLHMSTILEGLRGKPAVDIEAYCEAAAKLSVLALEFKDEIAELDINPVLLMEKGCLGLDALLVKNEVRL